MPADISFKTKYLELRTKYMSDIDTAFRLGFEQGAQQAQQQQALDAQAQAQEAQQQMAVAEAGGMQGGEPGQGQPSEAGASPEGAQPGMDANPAGSELDQHIGKLESMIGGGDAGGEQNPEIQKSIAAIVTLRKAEKFAMEMKKSENAIKGIVKALHKPSFKVGVQAQSNMNDNAKQAVSLQHKIVNDVFKSWNEQEAKAGKDIINILDVENLIKE